MINNEGVCMKRLKKHRVSKVTNWLHHRETRDDIWDYMATKWAVRAERLSQYGRSHLPSPVKSAIRSTINKPVDVAKKVSTKRREYVESRDRRGGYLQFSNDAK